MRAFWLCFVPLFVAVDPIGLMPVYVSLADGLSPASAGSVVRQSVLTAVAVALAFLAIGRVVMSLLGIKTADFMVAGGALLFAISLNDLLKVEKQESRLDPETIGAVPLGVPLITGPAVLTTSILLLNEHGLAPTCAALVLNIGIAGLALNFARRIHGFLGRAGTKTISKVANLLLAAIAVMVVRRGIAELLGGPALRNTH